MRIISKRLLLGCALAILCSNSGNLLALSFAEKSREIVKNRIEKLRTNARNLLKFLDGYQQCVFKGTCTSGQKSNLKKAGVAVAAAVTALLAAAAVTIFSQSGQLKESKEKLAAKQLELERVKEKPMQKQDPSYPFFVAVIHSNTDIANKYLNLGANIDKQHDLGGYSLSALDWAVRAKDVLMIKFLLQKGAYPLVQPFALLETTPEIKEIIEIKSKIGIVRRDPISKRYTAP